jgi:hypothetical protein
MVCINKYCEYINYDDIWIDYLVCEYSSVAYLALNDCCDLKGGKYCGGDSVFSRQHINFDDNLEC